MLLLPDSTMKKKLGAVFDFLTGSYLSIVRLGLGILDVVALVEASERL